MEKLITNPELEHKTYWAIKRLNLDADLVRRKRITQLLELEEFRLYDYENANLRKENTKRCYDKHIVSLTFDPCQLVLLFNSRLKLFPRTHRSKWSGPFEVVMMNQHGALELRNKDKSNTYLVKGKWVKNCFVKNLDRDLEVLTLDEE